MKMRHIILTEEFVKNIVMTIKLHLVWEYFGIIDDDDYNELFNGSLDKAWKRFVNEQKNGDCQGICTSIARLNLPSVDHWFGEIESDDGKLMTHHWITIRNKIFEFSKGTLSDYIRWDDVYDVESEDDTIYHKIRRK